MLRFTWNKFKTSIKYDTIILLSLVCAFLVFYTYVSVRGPAEFFGRYCFHDTTGIDNRYLQECKILADEISRHMAVLVWNIGYKFTLIAAVIFALFSLVYCVVDYLIHVVLLPGDDFVLEYKRIGYNTSTQFLYYAVPVLVVIVIAYSVYGSSVLGRTNLEEQLRYSTIVVSVIGILIISIDQILHIKSGKLSFLRSRVNKGYDRMLLLITEVISPLSLILVALIVVSFAGSMKQIISHEFDILVERIENERVEFVSGKKDNKYISKVSKKVDNANNRLLNAKSSMGNKIRKVRKWGIILLSIVVCIIIFMAIYVPLIYLSERKPLIKVSSVILTLGALEISVRWLLPKSLTFADRGIVLAVISIIGISSSAGVVEEVVHRLSSKTTCENCNETVPKSSHYCGKCGNIIDKEYIEYVASKNAKVVHRKECHFAQSIKPSNMTNFDSLESAEKSGFEKCRICIGDKIV